MEESPRLVIMSLSIMVMCSAGMNFNQYRSNYFMRDSPDDRVNVEFFVMSKCPDAKKCEQVFLPTLLRLSTIINFTVSYIAKQEDHQFECMHGSNECIGNRQQLCVQDLYSQNIFMKFLICQAGSIDAVPRNGQECAAKTSGNVITWSDVEQCIKSNKSDHLFSKALRQTHAAMVTKSCTILLNGKLWCIHDGFWRSCSEGHDEISLIRAICKRYPGINKPTVCPISI